MSWRAKRSWVPTHGDIFANEEKIKAPTFPRVLNVYHPALFGLVHVSRGRIVWNENVRADKGQGSELAPQCVGVASSQTRRPEEILYPSSFEPHFRVFTHVTCIFVWIKFVDAHGPFILQTSSLKEKKKHAQPDSSEGFVLHRKKYQPDKGRIIYFLTTNLNRAANSDPALFAELTLLRVHSGFP